MKDNVKRVTVYLNEDNCDYLEEKKDKKGVSYSDTVNAAIDNYRNSKVQKKAEELVKPTEDKLSQLLYNQVYIMQALGAIYRTGNYGSYLINNGLPIININGNDVVKPNQQLKDLARKKAMRNFTKLESEHVFVEDFLDDDEEDKTEVIGRASYNPEGFEPMGDGRAPERKDNNKKNNAIPFW